MIAYVFIGIKLADIMMIWRIMASMIIIRCSAGRMEWKNGFVLVLIEAIIEMLLMRGSNRNVIMIPGIIIGSCGFIILIIAGALAIIGMEWTCNHGDNDSDFNNSHYHHDNLFAAVQWLSIV